mmetsp:Transcript_18018/g.29860  ORF Transcript_18018/g.29860 Transcript_18018/m.29860 type:complete len:242 (+) Transcript_18018:1129-1854(+)
MLHLRQDTLFGTHIPLAKFVLANLSITVFVELLEHFIQLMGAQVTLEQVKQSLQLIAIDTTVTIDIYLTKDVIHVSRNFRHNPNSRGIQPRVGIAQQLENASAKGTLPTKVGTLATVGLVSTEDEGVAASHGSFGGRLGALLCFFSILFFFFLISRRSSSSFIVVLVGVHQFLSSNHFVDILIEVHDEDVTKVHTQENDSFPQVNTFRTHHSDKDGEYNEANSIVGRVSKEWPPSEVQNLM